MWNFWNSEENISQNLENDILYNFCVYTYIFVVACRFLQKMKMYKKIISSGCVNMMLWWWWYAALPWVYPIFIDFLNFFSGTLFLYGQEMTVTGWRRWWWWVSVRLVNCRRQWPIPQLEWMNGNIWSNLCVNTSPIPPHVRCLHYFQ